MKYICLCELNHCYRICLHGYSLSLSGCPLCPVVLRLQRQQRDVFRVPRSSAQPRGSREGRRHHPDPFQEVPTEETQERQVGGHRGCVAGATGGTSVDSPKDGWTL